MERDPVCGIELSVFPDTISASHEDKVYYFCNTSCKEKFLINPGQYISKKTGAVNMGKTDRDIRLFLGAACMAVFLKTSGLLKTACAVFGLIFTLTSITGFCPFYKLLNITTVTK